MDESEPKSLADLEKALNEIDRTIVQTTCFTCKFWKDCPLAFDIINTDGQCIMANEKIFNS